MLVQECQQMQSMVTNEDKHRRFALNATLRISGTSQDGIRTLPTGRQGLKLNMQLYYFQLIHYSLI